MPWQVKVEGFLDPVQHSCWILKNALLQFSYYCEWLLYIAPQATSIQGTEEQVKKMIRELPREDSTALYITKIRGSPEAELEKTPLFTTFITMQKFPEISNTIIVISEIKKAGGKKLQEGPHKSTS